MTCFLPSLPRANDQKKQVKKSCHDSFEAHVTRFKARTRQSILGSDSLMKYVLRMMNEYKSCERELREIFERELGQSLIES